MSSASSTKGDESEGGSARAESSSVICSPLSGNKVPLPTTTTSTSSTPSELQRRSDVHRSKSHSSLQEMGILANSAHVSPSQTLGSNTLPDRDELYFSHSGTSPTKRGSRLGNTLSKLHFRHPSSQSKKESGYGADQRRSFDGGWGEELLEKKRESVDGNTSGIMLRKGNSGPNSGKHTPSREVTGDFAEFLEAETLKAALKDEQEKAIKRELKAAKNPTKRNKDSVLGGKGKVQSPGERLREAAAAKKEPDYSPEGPTLEERGYFPGDLRHHGHLVPRPKLESRKVSHTSREREKIRIPGICGPVSDSDATSSDEIEEDDGMEVPDRKKPRGFSMSTTDSSSTESDILDQVQNPSVKSLKSWRSENSVGEMSLASGGANAKLAKPLLELEELELDSFLKNFGRHTREIRVPSSANFPRKRMPRWEDFKVPPGEAALAAAQGKRVTVLTHVDRGLQRLAASEGQDWTAMRPTTEESKDTKKTGKKMKGKHDDNSAAEDSAGGHTHKVSFAPFTGHKGNEHEPNRPPSPEMPFAGLRQRSIEKDEREAKRQEKEGSQERGQSSATGVVNVHDNETEWRPSRDEANMDEQEWELLHAEDEEKEVQVPEDEKVDGIAWAIAYILATVERYAPEELDNSPDQTYRESKTRSHIERLYLIAPFWERLLFGITRVYRWDNPRRTSSIMMIYFTLWYMDMIPTAALLMLMFYICQFRFFPPSASYLHEQVRARMARGVDADRLAERLRRRSRLDVLEIYKRFVVAYGQGTQLACGDVADFHEKVKNLILWRNPPATWRTLTLLGLATVFVTFASPHVIWKTVFFFLGFTFFILLPLQSHYPRFRRPLSPIWWALWGAPTDAQFAIQLLRRKHLERQHAKHPPLVAKSPDSSSASGVGEGVGNGRSGVGKELRKRLKSSAAAHAVAFGSMRPLNDGEGGLIDLRDTKVLDGQITSKPRKLGSFFCQHHGVPGHLHVTTVMLYFIALHSHVNKEGKGRKTCKTNLEDISGLVKTKSIKLFVWSSSGLQVIRKNKDSLFFSNMPHRDNAFNLLLAVGSEVWNKV